VIAASTLFDSYSVRRRRRGRRLIHGASSEGVIKFPGLVIAGHPPGLAYLLCGLLAAPEFGMNYYSHSLPPSKECDPIHALNSRGAI
jgi:hypothetical protein